ncbi:heme-binding-like protein At3g10130, chloroplastic isoform X2 [Quercus suber]|uniref:heme-binding-like protein At3g10130, chloroplastic isoform X2 n=1 Tax=Quercus suber TaxID=58331 RepID=UPI000CE1FAB2|nr:heme-binding-like protein At3g10130, chloroplastic isoform X2 [Quercus suber]
MANTQLSHHNFRPIPAVHVTSHRLSPTKPTTTRLPLQYFKNKSSTLKLGADQKHIKWAIGLSLVDQSPPKSTVDVERLVGFLYDDLPHLFDDQGIDRTAYDEVVKFRDPITKHDTISGYLFNITLLKTLFRPEFQLHWVKQLRMYKTPDLESPKYQILKRTANFEVRKYTPFIVVEANGDKLAGSTGFNDVTGYIFGKNSRSEKIPMTTPVFTQAFDAELSKVSIQVVLPLEKDISSLPDPNQGTISLRKVEGGIAAVLKFSGRATEDIVREKEKALRSSLINDGLKPKTGCLFARYNDPGRTRSFVMRNEVLIWLEEFSLD